MGVAHDPDHDILSRLEPIVQNNVLINMLGYVVFSEGNIFWNGTYDEMILCCVY